MKLKSNNLRLNATETAAFEAVQYLKVPMETVCVSIIGNAVTEAAAKYNAEHTIVTQELNKVAVELGANLLIHAGASHLRAHFDNIPPKYCGTQVWGHDYTRGDGWYELILGNQFAQALYDDYADRLGPFVKSPEARVLAHLFPNVPMDEALTQETFSAELSGFSVIAHLCNTHRRVDVAITAPAYNEHALRAYMKLRAQNVKDPMGPSAFEPCDAFEAALAATTLYEEAELADRDAERDVTFLRVRDLVSNEEADIRQLVSYGRQRLNRAKKKKMVMVATKKGKKIALPSPVADVGDNHPEAMKLYAKRTIMTKKPATKKGKA